ncbi:hypothetical protein L9F63_022390 [Diploptera punctata]|uniref:ENT domain-containing protein n=1 Tax=Diploptera punctata TaxID=6984 RepID=A0AAD8EB31_DIPPU|nr:hypothetical protein L9F63_022390 [Diploptera punctata]
MTMWPMILDMSRDECKRILRRLELEAYGNLVSVLRAQGYLSKEKRKLLQDLASTLNISMERHKAEVRRAVNDEKLATIAEHIAGPNTGTDWAIEGRRLIPLMPRLVPQTAFTALANNVANIAAAENAKLPPPSNTVKKNTPGFVDPGLEPSTPEPSKTAQRSGSPVVNKEQDLEEDEELEDKSKKRRRSSSADGQAPSPTPPPAKVANITAALPQAQPQAQTTTRTVSFPVGMTPVKITLTATPARSTVTTTTAASTTQKVIIVSSSTASGSPSILQRSLSVPIVKTVSTTSCTSSQPPRGASLIINNQNNTTSTGIVTIPDNLTPTTVSIGGIATTAYITSQGGMPKIRPKSVQLPTRPKSRSSSIVIPMTPNQITAAAAGTSNVLKTTLKPSLQIKQDPSTVCGGMKVCNATKILPKPTLSCTSQSPVYVMSTSTAMSVPASSAPRVVTLNTSCATSVPHIRPAGSSTGYLSKTCSKPIHIASQPAAGKPNVIVVQKGTGSAAFSRGVSITSHTDTREVVGKVIMSKSNSAPATVVQPASLSLPVSSAQGNVIVLDLSHEHLAKNSVLAEILQASGILTETGNTAAPEQPAAKGQTDWVPMENEDKQETNAVTAADNSQKTDVMDTPNSRVVTLEEAVQMLGHSDRSGLLTGQNSGGGEAAAPSSHQVMEVIGELDPQTGIYSIPTPAEGVGVVSQSDIFNTAIASANINLSTFQYIQQQEASNTVSTPDSSSSQSKQVVHYTQPSTNGSTIVVESISKQGGDELGEHLTSLLQPATGDSTAVTVEPSNMDTSEMLIEDFTSQKLQGHNNA